MSATRPGLRWVWCERSTCSSPRASPASSSTHVGSPSCWASTASAWCYTPAISTSSVARRGRGVPLLVVAAGRAARRAPLDGDRGALRHTNRPAPTSTTVRGVGAARPGHLRRRPAHAACPGIRPHGEPPRRLLAARHLLAPRPSTPGFSASRCVFRTRSSCTPRPTSRCSARPGSAAHCHRWSSSSHAPPRPGRRWRREWEPARTSTSCSSPAASGPRSGSTC